ncbi:DUF1330 domain-containing protein [Acidipila sp. EB88]|uniref:DUF1330 domain-containing protein n=1 Tax=Acidipila sp. EB88 TaxID=2305226 RepID=UPI0035197539
MPLIQLEGCPILGGVLAEFENIERALAWYDSYACTRAHQLRLGGSRGTIFLVEQCAVRRNNVLSEQSSRMSMGVVSARSECPRRAEFRQLPRMGDLTIRLGCVAGTLVGSINLPEHACVSKGLSVSVNSPGGRNMQCGAQSANYEILLTCRGANIP